MDCSPLGPSVHGISQAGILEWVAISFSRGSSQPRDATRVSCWAGGFFTAEPPGKPNYIQVETVRDFIFLGSKITANGDCNHEIKDICSLEESYDQPR